MNFVRFINDRGYTVYINPAHVLRIAPSTISATGKPCCGLQLAPGVSETVMGDANEVIDALTRER